MPEYSSDEFDTTRPPPRLPEGRYELTEPIGCGGMAEVWRAVDVRSREQVAIKVMLADELELEDVQRMSQEVEILKKLRHPCVVRVLGTGVTQDTKPYVVMEWVDGITLRDRFELTPVLPPHDVADIVGQICSALAEGHALKVIHRDVKPENVMLCAPEHLAVKVVDFGMAKVLTAQAPKLTFDSMLFGTPEYMAPERVTGADVGPGADLYGVAVMAFEMLVGERLFPGDNPVAVMTRHLREAPPPLPGSPRRSPASYRQGWPKSPLIDPMSECSRTSSSRRWSKHNCSDKPPGPSTPLPGDYPT